MLYLCTANKNHMPENNEISIYNPQDESVVVYRSEDANVTLEVRLANRVIKDYLLRGCAINQRLERLEQRVSKTEEQIDFFVRKNPSHDRWLIVDDQVYHCGHSLKDLGQKLSAVSLLGINAEDILKQVR